MLSFHVRCVWLSPPLVGHLNHESLYYVASLKSVPAPMGFWYIDWQVQSLGNPMMDDLEPTGVLSFLANYKPAKFIAVLPGSRTPEVLTFDPIVNLFVYGF